MVSHAKEDMKNEVICDHTPASDKILCDVRIRLSVDKSAKNYPDEQRLIEAVLKLMVKSRR